MKKFLLILSIAAALSASAPRLQAQSYAPDDTVSEYMNKGTIYANMFVGRKTSSGEIFSQDLYTAAHWKIKLGTIVLVTCPETGLQVLVKVNDRCPKRGVIDLTRKAAHSIGIKGCRRVVVRVLPDRYRYYWEHQDLLRGTREFDNMLSALYTPVEVQPTTKGTVTTTEKAPRRDNDEVVQLASKSAAAPNKTQVKKNYRPAPASETPCYDLDLTTVATRQEALAEIDKLPPAFQSKTVIIPAQGEARMKIRLHLALPQQQVYDIQSQLRPLFPNSTLRKVITE